VKIVMIRVKRTHNST